MGGRCYRLDGSLLPTRVGENLYLSLNPFSRAPIIPVYDIDLVMPLAYAQADSALAEQAVATPNDSEPSTDGCCRRRSRCSGNVPVCRFARSSRTWRIRSIRACCRATGNWRRAGPRWLTVTCASRASRGGRSTQDLAHALARGTLILLAFVGFRARGWRRDDAPVLLIPAGVILSCTIFFPTSRLMAPAVVGFMFYAAAGADALLRRAWRSRERQAGYSDQRSSTAPTVKPAPTDASSTRSPFFSRPCAARIRERQRDRAGGGVAVHLQVDDAPCRRRGRGARPRLR